MYFTAELCSYSMKVIFHSIAVRSCVVWSSTKLLRSFYRRSRELQSSEVSVESSLVGVSKYRNGQITALTALPKHLVIFLNYSCAI